MQAAELCVTISDSKFKMGGLYYFSLDCIHIIVNQFKFMSSPSTKIESHYTMN